MLLYKWPAIDRSQIKAETEAVAEAVAVARKHNAHSYSNVANALVLGWASE